MPTVYVQEQDVLRIGNSYVEVQLNKTTGALLALKLPGAGAFAGTPHQQSVQVWADGQPLLAAKASVLKYAVQRAPQSVAITLYQVARNGIDTVLTTYAVTADKPQVARVLAMHKGKSGRAKIEGFSYLLPGLRIGAAADCFVNVPGPFWPATHVAPDTPYDSLLHKSISFHAAPDGGFGIVALSNPKAAATVAAFIQSNGEVHYNTKLHTQDSMLLLEQRTNKAVYLKPGEQLVADTQRIVITTNLEQALTAYRNNNETFLPLAQPLPAWAREAVILEIFPDYFKGGFKEISGRLPFYKSIGFNTLYLMPHWKGGYSPIDLYQVNKKYGTADDLKTFVDKAHELGMKVLFDMVIHGFNKQSDVINKHPSFFYRNERDSLVIHPSWGSVMTDFMDTAYQRYMQEYVLYDQARFGNDGYRVDAASYKGPNWNPKIRYPAYQSGTASPQLMRLMLDALRKKNKDAVLLSEVFGPVFYTVSNFGHDNQTEAMSFLIKEMEGGRYTIAQYGRHIRNVYAALPKGAVRVFYARNHDTSWFYEFFGYSPLFMSMEAIHALFGVPEVFAGDPGYKFNPDDDPKVYEQYKKLFAARKLYPEFVHGERMWNAVQSNNEQVFAGMVSDGLHQSVALVSGSAAPQQVTLSFGNDVAVGNVVALNILNNTPVAVTPAHKGLQLTIAPYQVVILRLGKKQ